MIFFARRRHYANKEDVVVVGRFDVLDGNPEILLQFVIMCIEQQNPLQT